MVKDLELSKDAIPNFHKLQKSFSNGFLTVPTVGAGTVNTEFEMLTGMSQRDFGTSEYPGIKQFFARHQLKVSVMI